MDKTLRTLENNVVYAIKSFNRKDQQLKVVYAAFSRAYGIISKRKPAKEVKKVEASNPKHEFVLRLLAFGLKPIEVVNLRVKDCKNGFVCSRGVWRELPVGYEEYLAGKKLSDYLLYSNLGKKYNVRTVQEIRKKYKLAGGG